MISGARPFLVSAPRDSDEPFAERWPPAAYFGPRRAIEQACPVEYAVQNGLVPVSKLKSVGPVAEHVHVWSSGQTLEREPRLYVNLSYQSTTWMARPDDYKRQWIHMFY